MSVPVSGEREDDHPRTIGPYAVKRFIGSGSWADVYACEDPANARDVVVKILHSGHLQRYSEAILARFQVEVRVLSQLSHPNVVTVFDAGAHEGRPYLVLESCEGPSLAQALEDALRLAPTQVLWISRELSKALAYIHSMGLVHRDVKPANVLYDRGVLKLSDFGVVRVDPGDFTQNKVTSGAPSFLAPEQIAAETVDHRADLYGVALVLFQALSGRLPFSGSTTTMLYQIVHGRPASLLDFAPDLPKSLDAFFKTALAREPRDRYQTALDLHEAFRDALPSLMATPLRLRSTPSAAGRSPASPRPNVRAASSPSSESSVEASTESSVSLGESATTAMMSIVEDDEDGTETVIQTVDAYVRPLEAPDSVGEGDVPRASLSGESLAAISGDDPPAREDAPDAASVSPLEEASSGKEDAPGGFDPPASGGAAPLRSTPSKREVGRSPESRRLLRRGLLIAALLVAVIFAYGAFKDPAHIWEMGFGVGENLAIAVVSSEPSGARIQSTDGRSFGKTPANFPIRISDDGTVSLFVSKPGWGQSDVKTVPARSGQRITFSFKLKNPAAQLDVLTVPPDAEVRVDNRVVGTTPLTLEHLKVGQIVKLQISRDGFEPKTIAHKVEPGNQRIDISLKEVEVSGTKGR